MKLLYLVFWRMSVKSRILQNVASQISPFKCFFPECNTQISLCNNHSFSRLFIMIKPIKEKYKLNMYLYKETHN